MFVCIYAGERQDAAKFVRGDQGKRVNIYKSEVIVQEVVCMGVMVWREIIVKEPNGVIA